MSNCESCKSNNKKVYSSYSLAKLLDVDHKKINNLLEADTPLGIYYVDTNEDNKTSGLMERALEHELIKNSYDTRDCFWLRKEGQGSQCKIVEKKLKILIALIAILCLSASALTLFFIIIIQNNPAISGFIKVLLYAFLMFSTLLIFYIYFSYTNFLQRIKLQYRPIRCEIGISPFEDPPKKNRYC